MSKKILIMVIAMLWLLLNAQQNAVEAAFKTGTELKTTADASERIRSGGDNPDDAYDAGIYLGYVMGVVDAIHGRILCAPAETTAGQMAAIVYKFLKKNPEKWNKPANALVIEALKPTFGCNKR